MLDSIWYQWQLEVYVRYAVLYSYVRSPKLGIHDTIHVALVRCLGVGIL